MPGLRAVPSSSSSTKRCLMMMMPSPARPSTPVVAHPLPPTTARGISRFRRNLASADRQRTGGVETVRCEVPLWGGGTAKGRRSAASRTTPPPPRRRQPTAVGAPTQQQQQEGQSRGKRQSRCGATGGGKYYRVLQLEEDASLREVKAAYRRAVRRCHPDVDPSPQGRRRFQAISTAYAVLSKPTLRSIYDAYGVAGVKSFLDGRHPRDWSPARKFAGPPSQGEDVKTIVEIPLEEAVLGGNVTVAYESQRYCGVCQGSGYRLEAEDASCELCRGSGAVLRSTRTCQGDAVSLCPCPDCGGSGVYIEEYCDECVEGRLKQKESVGVKIPAGILPGSWIKLSLRGDVGKFGGASGDLYIGVQMARHSSIQRCGDDLYSEIKLSFVEAILGGATTVGTITAEASRLTIPRGTQHRAVLEVEGAGAPLSRASTGSGKARGSHFFQVSLIVPSPEALSAAELDVIRRLRALRHEERHQRSRTSSNGNSSTTAKKR